jgi:hypothetical protein
MTPIATDIDQSLRLLSLGVPIETADMYWRRKNHDNSMNPDNLFWEVPQLYIKEREIPQSDFENKYVPAWSLQALVDLFYNIDLIRYAPATNELTYQARINGMYGSGASFFEAIDKWLVQTIKRGFVIIVNKYNKFELH